MEFLDDEDSLCFDFEALLPDDRPQSTQSPTELSENTSIPRIPARGLERALQRKDFKRGTVVCRHWLRGLCMKGDTCEFLHQYDLSKMPECRWGIRCEASECPFRHVPDEERVECTYYRQGFCMHGPICRYRHVKRPSEECPEEADFNLQSEVIDDEGVKRRKTQRANEFYKIALCKHWAKAGSCPFGDECHFAHGDDQLRPYPQSEQKKLIMDPADLPDATQPTRYLVVPFKSYPHFGQCIQWNTWFVYRDLSPRIRGHLANCEGQNILLIFTVEESEHFQGCARIVNGWKPIVQDKDPTEKSMEEDCDGQYGLEILRVCELPYSEDIVVNINQCKEEDIFLSETTGHQLIVSMYEQSCISPQYDLGSMMTTSNAKELASRRKLEAEAAENLYSSSVGARHWKVSGPGFIFACNNGTIRECFGRQIFGLVADHEQQASVIHPGMPLFLINMSDKHLFGIFEAMTPMISNLEPEAFSRGAKVPSPFPIQVHFFCQLDAPPILETDPAVKEIFGEKGVRIGPISFEHTQRLADILAARCGASNFHSAVATSKLRGVKPDSFTEKMIIGIDSQEFQPARRIIGKGGENLKRIVAKAGGNTKLCLRGKGSGVREDPSSENSNELLQLVVTSDNQISFEIACGLAADMLHAIHVEYEEFISYGNRHSRGGWYHPASHRPPAPAFDLYLGGYSGS